ncbi:MAG: Lrp/AsnC ligand binding domain-containing protein [Candidatus Bathyarchaeia archaeon]
MQSRKIKGITLANSVLGRFDAIAVIEADNSDHLAKIIYEMIEKNPNVVHTETLLSMFIP